MPGTCSAPSCDYQIWPRIFFVFFFEIPVFLPPQQMIQLFSDQPVGVPDVQDTHHEKHPVSSVKKLIRSLKTPTYVTQHLSLKYHFFRGVFPVFSALGSPVTPPLHQLPSGPHPVAHQLQCHLATTVSRSKRRSSTKSFFLKDINL